MQGWGVCERWVREVGGWATGEISSAGALQLSPSSQMHSPRPHAPSQPAHLHLALVQQPEGVGRVARQAQLHAGREVGGQQLAGQRKALGLVQLPGWGRRGAVKRVQCDKALLAAWRWKVDG